MLTCRDLTELVTDYLEGRLGLAARARFQLHLGMCRHCRAYLRQLRASIGATRALADTELPPELQAELLRRFRHWKMTG